MSPKSAVKAFPHCIFTLTALFFMAGLAAASPADDLAVIKSRILEPLLSAPSREAVDRRLDALGPDGSFSDVDYADTNGGNWRTSAHLSHVLVLARAWASKESDRRGDRTLRDAVMRSLDYWLDRDFMNSNWWWNQIGVPGRMSLILLIMEDELSDGQRDKGVRILERAKIRMTGANLVDVAFITMKRGILEKKPAVVREAVDSIAAEIRITTEEGIQPDWSFHQHGALLYNHGYGAVFMSNCARLAVQVNGTSFALPREKIDILSGLILDGTRWMIRFSTKDYGATGRGITRRAGNSASAGYLREIVENMRKLPTGLDNRFRGMLMYLDGTSGYMTIGNRHFWRSDIMTHHRPDWYASARMFSDRLLNTDRPHNGEGLKSHHLADGCTYIMRSGMEYHDIFPVWDWRKIPGTTVEQKPELTGDICRKGTRPFAGGVSDGEYGVAAFDFERDGLEARKAWFFFQGEFMCLGAGVFCPTDNPVVTTVNQCFLKGGVLVPGGPRPRTIEAGTHDLDGVRYVWHDSVAYVFPENRRVRLENDVRTGSWGEISRQYPMDEIKREVFTLWIDHGIRPENETYSYIVAPGLSAEAVADYAQSPPVETVVNTPELQAVRHRYFGIVGAAFYEPGRVAAGDMTVAVDTPCLVLAKADGDGCAVSVSNPENEKASVKVTIERSGKGRAEVLFDLPGGMEAGMSVTKNVEFR